MESLTNDRTSISSNDIVFEITTWISIDIYVYRQNTLVHKCNANSYKLSKRDKFVSFIEIFFTYLFHPFKTIVIEISKLALNHAHAVLAV